MDEIRKWNESVIAQCRHADPRFREAIDRAFAQQIHGHSRQPSKRPLTWHAPERPAKRPKVAETPRDDERSKESTEMAQLDLELARATRQVYVNKLETQRLRMEEIRVLISNVKGEEEETGRRLREADLQIIALERELAALACPSGQPFGLNEQADSFDDSNYADDSGMSGSGAWTD